MRTALDIAGFALAAATVAASSILAAASLRFRSVVEFVLAAFVIGWAIVVATLLALSPPGALTVGWEAVALLVTLAVTSTIWYTVGRPVPTGGRAAVIILRSALRDPVLACLTVATAVCVTYSLLLILFVTQNDGDALAYHIPRAMFWVQQHSIGYIPHATDSRLNVNPPNAEIGMAFTLLFSRTDRYVALPQFISYLSCMTAIFGISRRLSFGVPQALFGSLIFATLPIVVLQTSAAMNDLVVAAFLLVTAYFLLGTRRADSVLAVAALALAVGTKFTAVLCVPLLMLVAALGPSRTRLVRTAVLGAIGVLVGSLWYAINLYETGKPDGGLAQDASQLQAHSVAAVATGIRQLALDALDLSGTRGRDMLAYPIAATGLLLIAFAVAGIKGRRNTRVVVGAAIAITVLPLIMFAVGRLLNTVSGMTWRLTGRADPLGAGSGGFEPSQVAEAGKSWFGPVAIPLLVVAIACVWKARSGSMFTRTAVLELAPIILMVEIGTLLVHDAYRGRFFMFAFGLAAVPWGLVLNTRLIAWAATTACVTAMTLSVAFNLAKPSGLVLLESSNYEAVSRKTVWGRSSWDTQTILRPGTPEIGVIRFAQEQIPKRTTIALALPPNAFLSPYFGPHLSRTVRLVRPGERATEDSDWLVIGPGSVVVNCPASWRSRLSLGDGWTILERSSNDRCD